jgi:dimeric dUTPase (all-alpha-NTP-PPase superfamily)
MFTLTTKTYTWLIDMQSKLDNQIKHQKNIEEEYWLEHMEQEHNIAIRVEVAEFINECHDAWKYWKSKPVNKEKILDEAIDVIHFSMLILNKGSMKPNDVKVEVDFLMNKLIKGKDNLPLSHYLHIMLKARNVTGLLSLLLFVLDHYGFTEEDIIEQYKRKNAINFERLQEGY